MIKFLVHINQYYDNLQERDPIARLFVLMFFVAGPIVIITNVGRVPWWLTTTALFVLITGFFVRFMWAVLHKDMIQYVRERKSVSHNS